MGTEHLNAAFARRRLPRLGPKAVTRGLAVAHRLHRGKGALLRFIAILPHAPKKLEKKRRKMFEKRLRWVYSMVTVTNRRSLASQGARCGRSAKPFLLFSLRLDAGPRRGMHNVNLRYISQFCILLCLLISSRTHNRVPHIGKPLRS